MYIPNVKHFFAQSKKSFAADRLRKKNQYDIFNSMATDTAQLLVDKKAELAEIKAAMSKIRRQQAYSLKDGQGEQSVTRAAYKDLAADRRELENDILALENPNSDAGFYARPL